MEKLLHYVWKHRLYDESSLVTTNGERVQVLTPGVHNNDAGPDFENAKIIIENLHWAGNIEIHIDEQEWYRHRHHEDSAYDNTILHVIEKKNVNGAIASNGNTIPTLLLEIPQSVKDNYEQLLRTSEYPRCYRVIPSLDRLKVNSWLNALTVERIEERAERITQRAVSLDGDWEHAFFITLARNFGFGKNGDEFEQWAKSLPLGNLVHHRDDLFQIESFFLGAAGLLKNGPKQHLDEGRNDEYRLKMLREYEYLCSKFSYTGERIIQWRFLRMRPHSFPHIRISQLADLYCREAISLSAIVDCKTIEDYEKLLQCSVSEYWRTHFAFGCLSPHSEKCISKKSRHLIIINTIVPTLWAYGKHQQRQDLCNRAFDLLEDIDSEDNFITRQWQQCGINVRKASDSQALIQLKRTRCDNYDCLRCRFAYEYIKSTRK